MRIMTTGRTFLAFLAFASLCVAALPDYPLLHQCGESWSDDYMDTKTICEVGCLMSSVSEGLAGYNISIDGAPSNPGTLNAWLRDNNGYDGSNDLFEAVVQEINPEHIVWPSDGMHKTKDLSYETVGEYVDSGRVVISNVLNGTHFVLTVGQGTDGDTLIVRDSGFDRTEYSYSRDVVGFRIYDISYISYPSSS